MTSIPVLSAQQAASWDSAAARAGYPLLTLMDAAGRAVAVVLMRRFAAEASRGVLIAAGSGNNGGDGWVAAWALHQAGVSVWVAASDAASSTLNAAARQRAMAAGVRSVASSGPWPTFGVVVDALLGTGASGAPRDATAAVLQRLREASVPIVAIDGPSGLDLGTGVCYGDARADLSITFGGVRRGHLLARDESGQVVIVDVGHPPPDPDLPRLVGDAWAAQHLPAFAANAHKGTRGRVVIVGGAPGMGGAVRLAARAALAAGAGYAHVVTAPATAQELRLAEPDLLVSEQALDEPASAATLDLLRRADTVVLGPGFGRGSAQRELIAELIAASRRCVLDADGLTAFAGDAARLAALAAGRTLILTPHPGEFRSVFPALAHQRELDPWGAAIAASATIGGTVLLKGVPTVIGEGASPPLTVASGNPGLGSGGSGDVLSGIVGTLSAQELEPQVAAAVAAQALGAAGDLAARRFSARSMRPMDTIAMLPQVWRAWQRRGLSAPAAIPELTTLAIPSQ